MITPAAATETAKAYFSRRNKADERLTAYIEKELGKKPAKESRCKRPCELSKKVE